MNIKSFESLLWTVCVAEASSFILEQFILKSAEIILLLIFGSDKEDKI